MNPDKDTTQNNNKCVLFFLLPLGKHIQGKMSQHKVILTLSHLLQAWIKGP
jgi:hypothetical protein